MRILCQFIAACPLCLGHLTRIKSCDTLRGVVCLIVGGIPINVRLYLLALTTAYHRLKACPNSRHKKARVLAGTVLTVWVYTNVDAMAKHKATILKAPTICFNGLPYLSSSLYMSNRHGFSKAPRCRASNILCTHRLTA